MLPKGINANAPATPIKDKIEKPHDEHPTTNIPKIVLPPTVIPSFTPGFLSANKSLDINSIFMPTRIDETIKSEKSIKLSAEYDPSINWNMRLSLKFISLLSKIVDVKSL